jgi:PKD repeat protein
MITLSAQAEAIAVPAVAYHWELGDGTSADSAKVSHAYTSAGDFTIRLRVDGVDGISAHQTFSIRVTGNLRAHSNLTDNRRFVEPTDR